MAKPTCPECGGTHKPGSRALDHCQTEAEWLLGHLIIQGEFDKPELSSEATETRKRADQFAAYLRSL